MRRSGEDERWRGGRWKMERGQPIEKYKKKKQKE